MRIYALILALSFTLVSCAQKPSPKSASYAEKPKNKIEETVEFLPPQVETALGEAIYSRMMRTQKKLEVSEEFQAYLNEVSKKIGENTHRPKLNYETIILDSKEVVAFGLPGGRVLISKGYLDLVKTESELANLIANQQAHIARQHLIHDLMMNAEFAQALNKADVTTRVIQQSIFILTEQGFVVQMINSADRLAPTYAMHVGYSTDGLLNLLISLKNAYEKKGGYGKTDQTFDMINHRVSMNRVYTKNLETTDKSGFPKSEDRFMAMIKKIKPVKKK